MRLALFGGLLTLVCVGIVQSAEPVLPPMLVLDARGHTAKVWQVLFTPDDQELLSVSYDGTIRFWNCGTGEPTRTWYLPHDAAGQAQLSAAALSSDGQWLAVGSLTPDRQTALIYLLHRATGQIKHVMHGHKGPITSLAFSPDDSRLASASHDQTARLWIVATGQLDRALAGHNGYVSAVAFSPDGQRLATGSLDKTAALWEASTGRLQTRLVGHDKGVRCLAWSPDGQQLATGGDDHAVRLWSPGGKPLQVLPNLGSTLTALQYMAKQRQLLCVYGGVRAGKGAVLLDLATGQAGMRFEKHIGQILCGQLSRDGTLAATADRLGEIYLWRTGDGIPVHHLASQSRPVVQVGWSSQDYKIAWGTTMRSTKPNLCGPLERTFDLRQLELGLPPGPTYHTAQTTMEPFSLQTGQGNKLQFVQGGQRRIIFQPAEKFDTLRCFTFLNKDQAAVGTELGLKLLQAPAWQAVTSWQGHGSAIMAVAPSPAGQYLLSGSLDQTLRIWRPGRSQPLLSLFVVGNDWIVWTPEGYYAASPGGERLMGWQVDNGPDRLASFYPAVQFRSSLHRPDVIKRVLTTGSVATAVQQAAPARKQASVPAKVEQILPPRVRLLSPTESNLRVKRSKVEVTAQALRTGSHPVTGMRLLLNGRPYQGDASFRRITTTEAGPVQESWLVPLEPGPNHIAVQAESAVSKGSSEEIKIVYEPERGFQADTHPVELPNLYILAIGISGYAGDLQLNYAARDAEALVESFQKHSKSLFRQIQVKTLTEANASRSAILQGLGWLRRAMTQRDIAVVFFAGHGQRDSDGSLYFLPVDVDVQDLLSTGVSAYQFKTTLTGLPGRILFILDACHAGAVDVPKTRSVVSLTDDLIRDLVTEESGVVALCASTGREFALENNEHRHGAFTQALLEGLAGKAHRDTNGAVYLYALNAYLTERVKELTNGRQHPVSAVPPSVRSFPLSLPELLRRSAE